MHGMDRDAITGRYIVSPEAQERIDRIREQVRAEQRQKEQKA